MSEKDVGLWTRRIFAVSIAVNNSVPDHSWNQSVFVIRMRRTEHGYGVLSISDCLPLNPVYELEIVKNCYCVQTYFLLC